MAVNYAIHFNWKPLVSAFISVYILQGTMGTRTTKVLHLFLLLILTLLSIYQIYLSIERYLQYQTGTSEYSRKTRYHQSDIKRTEAFLLVQKEPKLKLTVSETIKYRVTHKEWDFKEDFMELNYQSQRYKNFGLSRNSLSPTLRPNLRPNSDDSLYHVIDSCKIFGST